MISALPVYLAIALGTCPDPYCRTHVDTGDPNDPRNQHCLWWGTTTLTYNINDQGNPATEGNPATAGATFAAIEKAWASWQQVSNDCGNFTIQEGPRVSDRTTGYIQHSNNNKNLILFRTRLCDNVVPPGDSCRSDSSCPNKYDCWASWYSTGTIALTTSTYDTGTGQIYRADIEFNAANPSLIYFTAVDSPRCLDIGHASQGCVGTDIQNTATHEIGHFLGLDHTTFLPGISTMQDRAGFGELNKRTVDSGSRSFVCVAYPKGQPARDCILSVATSTLGQSSGCAVSSSRSPKVDSSWVAWPLALLAIAALARRR